MAVRSARKPNPLRDVRACVSEGAGVPERLTLVVR